MKYRIIPKDVIRNEHLLQQKGLFFWKTIDAGTLEKVTEKFDLLMGNKFVDSGIGVVPPKPWPPKQTVTYKKRVVEEESRDSGPDIIDVAVTAALLNSINDNSVETPREEAFDGFKGGESGGGGAERSFDSEPSESVSESVNSDFDSGSSDSFDSGSSDCGSCDCGGCD